jgi:hypothetical protein
MSTAPTVPVSKPPSPSKTRYVGWPGFLHPVPSRVTVAPTGALPGVTVRLALTPGGGVADGLMGVGSALETVDVADGLTVASGATAVPQPTKTRQQRKTPSGFTNKETQPLAP